MTESEALRHAVDWLRAFPALPTAAPGYAERRAAAVETLAEMLAEAEQEERDEADERRRLDAVRAEYAARGGCWACDGLGLVRGDPMGEPVEPCPECGGGGGGRG